MAINIAQCLRARGKPLCVVAESSGISRSCLHEARAGARSIRLDQFERIARGLMVEPADLAGTIPGFIEAFSTPRASLATIFVRNLKAGMRRSAIPVLRLAALAGVAKTSVYDVVNRQVVPGLDEVADLAAALGTTAADLFRA